METFISLLATLNSLSPLAVIALLGLCIFLLLKNNSKVETVATNHLHDLPEVVETMREMNATLRRMEVRMAEEFTYLRAKINGGPKY